MTFTTVQSFLSGSAVMLTGAAVLFAAANALAVAVVLLSLKVWRESATFVSDHLTPGIGELASGFMLRHTWHKFMDDLRTRYEAGEFNGMDEAAAVEKALRKFYGKDFTKGGAGK